MDPEPHCHYLPPRCLAFCPSCYIITDIITLFERSQFSAGPPSQCRPGCHGVCQTVAASLSEVKLQHLPLYSGICSCLKTCEMLCHVQREQQPQTACPSKQCVGSRQNMELQNQPWQSRVLNLPVIPSVQWVNYYKDFKKSYKHPLGVGSRM